MLIKSQAGEFEIKISRFELEGKDLVMIGAMGVWEARTHVSPRDAVAMLWLLMTSAAVWAYVLRLPYFLLRRAFRRVRDDGDPDI